MYTILHKVTSANAARGSPTEDGLLLSLWFGFGFGRRLLSLFRLLTDGETLHEINRRDFRLERTLLRDRTRDVAVFLHRARWFYLPRLSIGSFLVPLLRNAAGVLRADPVTRRGGGGHE